MAPGKDDYSPTWIAWLCGALLLIGSPVLTAGCGQEQKQPASETPQAPPAPMPLDPASLPVLDIENGRLLLDESTDASTLLLSGWGPVETGSAWTLAPQARLAFRVSGPDAEPPLTFTLKFVALMVDGQQGYRIKSGSQVVAADTLSSDAESPLFPFEVTFQLTPTPDGVVVLDIETDRLASPASLGLNADERTLGLALALGEMTVNAGE